MPFPGIKVAKLDHKLQAADVARRFVSALDRPSHLQECGNRDRSFENWKIAAHEGVRRERIRTENTNAAVAEIMNAAVKLLFLGQGVRRLTRWQAPCVHLEHLRETLVLASFSI